MEVERGEIRRFGEKEIGRSKVEGNMNKSERDILKRIMKKNCKLQNSGNKQKVTAKMFKKTTMLMILSRHVSILHFNHFPT